MYPHERSLVEKYSADPFAIVGINSDSSIEKAREVVEKNKINWLSFYDGSPGGPISTRWNVTGWPTIYLIDAKGIIRYKNIRGKEMDDAIELLVQEAKAEQAAEKSK